MAVELVASALLTAVFDKLFERLTSTEFKNFFRGKKLAAEQLNALQKKLNNVSLLLDDAEDRQLDDPKVKEWLDDLKVIIFKVDDLVEDINAELRSDKEIEQQPGCCVCAWMKSIFTQFDKTVRDEMKKYSEGLDDLLSRVENLKLKDGVPRKTGPSSQKSLFVPLREERSVFGRDKEKEKIVKFLLSSYDDKERIGVLPIVGMGGLGKTTLAQLAYNDERVSKDRFELRAWVTVSTDFDVSKIIKSLLQQINCESKTEEPAVLQQQLKEGLRGKKFLFVLDDVWDENYSNWDLLRTNFLSGDPRSKIIVTTRSRRVCSNVKTRTIHELESVSADDCWEIFTHHAFNGDSNAFPQLEKIGKEIVEKCKGLPLAVKCVGGLLRSERDPKKWEIILRSRVWSSNNENGVLPSLWLSYRCLPSPLKQCFAYCAIFPQDYRFEKERMVLLWMAEGFLQPDRKEKSLEEVGDEYFEVLVSRSFFQRHRENGYVMHDLVHDLATFVSGEFCLNLSRDKKMGNTSSKTRYLYCNAKLESDSVVKVLGEATYLHTYIDESWRLDNWSTPWSKKFLTKPRTYTHTTYSLVKEILDEGRFLRVLSVPNQNISELLNSSKNHLKHLRYLNLSNIFIEEVLDSVCTLYSLQTLDLSYCMRLSKLPKNIGNLTNLRHLSIAGSYLIKKMPPRMGNLKELRTLTDFVLGKADDDDGCSSIKELGELRHLAGQLRVRGLQNVETVDDARKANFRDKGNLVRLVLEWDGEEAANTGSEMEVLDALQPHTNLEDLSILGYRASNFPNWVGDSSFSKMVRVSLSGGSHDSCHWLPPLGQLPSLKRLDIESFHGVESIGSEFYGGNSISSFTPFPCLEDLKFVDMKRWKEWSFVGRDGEEISACFQVEGFENLKSLNGTAFQPIKSLQRLRIWNCMELESLPEQVLPNSLCYLDIYNCPLLERRYRKQKGDDWRYISHIPEIIIGGKTTTELKEQEKRENQNSASTNA